MWASMPRGHSARRSSGRTAQPTLLCQYGYGSPASPMGSWPTGKPTLGAVNSASGADRIGVGIEADPRPSRASPEIFMRFRIRSLVQRPNVY